MDALGDNGNFRYYTNEVTYVVGTGLRPWYGVQPRLMNMPLPEDTLVVCGHGDSTTIGREKKRNPFLRGL